VNAKRLPSIRPGQPVLMGSTVGHVACFKAGEWSGRVYVESDGRAFGRDMHRDSVTVLEGPALSPAMVKKLGERYVMGK